jgi:TonB family protein
MRVRAFVHSCILHLAVILLLVFGLRSTTTEEEVPIELMEFLKAQPRAARPTTAPPVVLPRKSTPSATLPAPMSESASSSATTSPTDVPPGSVQGIGEPTAEEYQVSELPTLINEIRIPYPPSAKAKGIQGAVVFDIIVNSRGEVQSAKVVKSPSQELSDAAKSAVGAFRFRPARVKDKPVAIQIRYTYRFILE